MAKWSIRGVLCGLFLVMAFLQLGGFLLIFFRFARVHAFSLLAGFVYTAIALMLLRRGRRRTD
jgi:small neutral amino acid transporter SnatA (MarC family)